MVDQRHREAPAINFGHASAAAESTLRHNRLERLQTLRQARTAISILVERRSNRAQPGISWLEARNTPHNALCPICDLSKHFGLHLRDVS